MEFALLKFFGVEKFKWIRFLLKIPKNPENYICKFERLFLGIFFACWVNFTPIFRQRGVLIFTNNCLFHFFPLHIHKQTQFQNELIFNETSYLRFSRNMTILKLPSRGSCCWSTRFHWKCYWGRQVSCRLESIFNYNNLKMIRILASFCSFVFTGAPFCIYLLCGSGLVIDVNSLTNGWQCLELEPLRNSIFSSAEYIS